MELLLAIFKTLRPRQWLKNVALFAALVFGGFLFVPGNFTVVFKAVGVFTILASCTYIFNDLLDIESDRKHPFKNKRPVASGKLPMPVAVFVLTLGLFVGLWFGFVLGFLFFVSALAYLGLQLLYTLWLKKVPIMDVIVIAIGYALRVYAGAFVINAHLSVWFLLTVISVALFLAIGKRRSELTLLKGKGVAASVRTTLGRYTDNLLDVYTGMFANATWLTYALFTFNHPPIIPDGKVLTVMSFLPKTLLSEKLLMATTPLVIYGVMRYLQLIYEKNEGESPERVLLSDKPLIATVLIWGVMIVVLLYFT